MARLLPLVLSMAFLAGCGQTGLQAPTVRKAAFQAKTDAGLRAGVVELRKLRFKRLDLNEDGALTRSEASDEALRLPGVVEGFADYDVNGDGRIPFEPEFLREDVIHWWMGELRPKMQEMFFRIDTNRDFKLTGKELDTIKLYFSLYPETHGADLNQDGEVPFGEFEDAYMYILPKIQPQPTEQAFLKKLPAIR